MLREKTLLIVGAGASKEYNLPLGSELRSKISDLVNFKFDEWGHKLVSGNQVLWNSIDAHCMENQIRDRNTFRQAGERIAENMPLADSIDEFVESANDPNVEYVAKLGIAKAILDSERESTLYFKEHRNYSDAIDYTKISDTWLPKLFSKIRKGHNPNNLDDLFKNLTIITFNYDRTIEHYFFNSSKRYFDLFDLEASDLVRKLEIYHPYGSVGNILADQDPSLIPLGEELQNYNPITQRIRTYSESLDKSRSWVEATTNAQKIIFLGCHFHKANMDLIKPNFPKKTHTQIFATIHERSESATTDIRNMLADWAATNTQSVFLYNGKSNRLFDEYDTRLLT